MQPTKLLKSKAQKRLNTRASLPLPPALGLRFDQIRPISLPFAPFFCFFFFQRQDRWKNAASGDPDSQRDSPLKKRAFQIANLGLTSGFGDPGHFRRYLEMSSRGRTNNGTKQHIDPQLPILDVAPLNSVPYFGPSIPQSNIVPSQPEMEAEAVENVGPSIMYFPSHSTEEWDKLLGATKSGVGLVGSAAMGKMGPVVGAVDIGECEDSYLFRVSLPGVSRDEKDFRCDVEPDGKIFIKGVTTTGEKTIVKNSQIFKMTQNLCPPGHFSISFQLPGPVNHQQLTGFFGTNGILEGIVKKRHY